VIISFAFLLFVGIEGVGCAQLSGDTGRQLEACHEAHQLGFDQQRVLCVQQPKQLPATFGIYAIAQTLTELEQQGYTMQFH